MSYSDINHDIPESLEQFYFFATLLHLFVLWKSHFKKMGRFLHLQHFFFQCFKLLICLRRKHTHTHANTLNVQWTAREREATWFYTPPVMLTFATFILKWTLKEISSIIIGKMEVFDKQTHSYSKIQSRLLINTNLSPILPPTCFSKVCSCIRFLWVQFFSLDFHFIAGDLAGEQMVRL